MGREWPGERGGLVWEGGGGGGEGAVCAGGESGEEVKEERCNVVYCGVAIRSFGDLIVMLQMGDGKYMQLWRSGGKGD